MVVEERKASADEWLPGQTSGAGLMKTAGPEGVAEAGYYGIPMLKRPLWHWHIALYFFLEGISAGAYTIATTADLFGRGRHRQHRQLKRAARYISLATLLPCPPLLIADLGRPERFHHMLRVFKLSSPMNTGAWALSGYSLPVGLLAAKQLAGDVAFAPPVLKKAGALVPARLTEALGLPFAFTMISYPGVLLSTTSTPVWSRTRYLGALIACSSMSTGAAALSLALAVRGDAEQKSVAVLEKIENIAALCEGGALAAYLLTAGKTAEPLTKGRYAKHLWLGAVGAGLVAPALLRTFSARGREKKNRLAQVLGSALTLAGGLALKWSITYAGRVSAESAEAARHASSST